MRPCLAILPLLLCGCAIHAATELHNSQQVLRDAERADVDGRTLYERTKAELWIIEARREAAHSRYKSSVELAREARALAEQALEQTGPPPEPAAPSAVAPSPAPAPESAAPTEGP